jgi:hypothetical protein
MCCLRQCLRELHYDHLDLHQLQRGLDPRLRRLHGLRRGLQRLHDHNG